MCPILEYASPVWDPHTQCNINDIESVQRRAARFVSNDYSRTNSVTSMIQALNWPKPHVTRTQNPSETGSWSCLRCTSFQQLMYAEYSTTLFRSQEPYVIRCPSFHQPSDYGITYRPRQQDAPRLIPSRRRCSPPSTRAYRITRSVQLNIAFPSFRIYSL